MEFVVIVYENRIIAGESIMEINLLGCLFWVYLHIKIIFVGC